MIKQMTLLFFFFLFFIIFSGCSAFNISSKWKDKEININGKDSKWNYTIQNKNKFSIGCCNDDNFLYLCISFNEKNNSPALLKLLEQNFTVSFYALEKNNIIYGLKFTNLRNENPAFQDKTNSFDQTSDINSNAMNNNESSSKNIIKNNNIEVLIGNKPVGKIADIKGTEASYDEQFGEYNNIVYELKIPIAINDNVKYAINLYPSNKINKIGITLEASDEFNMNDHDKNLSGKEKNNHKTGNGNNDGRHGGNGKHSIGEGNSIGKKGGNGHKSKNSGNESFSDYMFRQFLSFKINGVIILSKEKNYPR